jgi:hypothetical protein
MHFLRGGVFLDQETSDAIRILVSNSHSSC